MVFTSQFPFSLLYLLQQGINGIVAMLVLMLPSKYIWIGDAPLDDFIDGCVQIYNSLPLTILIGVFILSVAAFNYAAVEVALRLSTVHRALFDSCRMITVWVICIVLYYTGMKNYGEGTGKFMFRRRRSDLIHFYFI
jgi:hypothetical protein